MLSSISETLYLSSSKLDEAMQFLIKQVKKLNCILKSILSQSIKCVIYFYVLYHFMNKRNGMSIREHVIVLKKGNT